MPAFKFSALDASGHTRKGILESDSDRQARQQLRNQGLAPLSVSEILQPKRGRSPFVPYRQKLTARELALITRQLATLARSGLPLEETLHIIAQQTDKARIKGILMDVHTRVLEGRSLAESLGAWPDLFPDFYRATVEAGEESGHLSRVLKRLADYLDSSQEARKKVQLALLYPTILTSVAVLVVAGLLSYVVPQVVRVFAHMNENLPAITRILISVSDITRAYGLHILLVLLSTVVGIRYLLRMPPVRMWYHRVLLRLPLISRLIRESTTARLARTLSILIGSSLPVVEALQISSRGITNLPMRQAVEQAAVSVREGAALHSALDQSGYFPPISIHLIASGEASGSLEAMLERDAEYEERSVGTLVSFMIGLFEPLLILVMGGVVLLIVIAILLPIFELNELVG